MKEDVEKHAKQLAIQFGGNAKYVALEVIEALKCLDYNSSVGVELTYWQQIKNHLD